MLSEISKQGSMPAWGVGVSSWLKWEPLMVLKPGELHGQHCSVKREEKRGQETVEKTVATGVRARSACWEPRCKIISKNLLLPRQAQPHKTQGCYRSWRRRARSAKFPNFTSRGHTPIPRCDSCKTTTFKHWETITWQLEAPSVHSLKCTFPPCLLNHFYFPHFILQLFTANNNSNNNRILK